MSKIDELLELVEELIEESIQDEMDNRNYRPKNQSVEDKIEKLMYNIRNSTNDYDKKEWRKQIKKMRKGLADKASKESVNESVMSHAELARLSATYGIRRTND